MVEINRLGRCGAVLVAFISLSIVIMIALQAATLHLYRIERGVTIGSKWCQTPYMCDYMYNIVSERPECRIYSFIQAVDTTFWSPNDDIRNLNKDSTNADSPNIELPLQDYLRQTFPGRFFTDTEIVEFAQSFANLTSSALNITISKVFTPLCVGDYCRIIMGEIYTCCCKAQTGFISPPTAVDATDHNRTLTQFHGDRQYFYTETCTQVGSDPSCTCVENPLLASAVYNINARLKNYGVTFFRLGNTCIALNT